MGDVVGARRQNDDDDYHRRRRPLSSVCVACVRSWALAVVRGRWLLFEGAGCCSRVLAVIRGHWLLFEGAGCCSRALAVVRGRWLSFVGACCREVNGVGTCWGMCWLTLALADDMGLCLWLPRCMRLWMGWSFDGWNIIMNELHAVTIPRGSPSARASPWCLQALHCILQASKASLHSWWGEGPDDVATLLALSKT